MRLAHRCTLRLLAASATLGAAAFVVPAGGAAILAPQTVDAATGMDALDVGTAFGARSGWAAFTQTTNGNNRLYVAFARNGTFGAPQVADRGNAVIGASLGGNRKGQAVAVFTEDVAGSGILFGRRLGGGGGPVLQVSADTQSASLPNAAAGLQHVRAVAMNASGTAAVCYRNALSASSFVAVLAPGAAAWQRFGPLKVDQCMDIGVDARGNVIVVGQDVGADLYADLVVGGVLKSELIDADGMDEPSLALSPTGNAVVLARVDAGGGAFGVAAWRKSDIASDAPWSKLGRIDENATDFNTEASEFPRGAIGPDGNGILTFRAFNPTTVAGRIFFVRLTGSTVGPATFVAPENDDAVPEIDTNGQSFFAYTATMGGIQVPVVHVVSRTTIRAARRLVPVGTPETELRNVVGFVGDGTGNFLAQLRSGAAPIRAVAVFGDFQAPTLRPRSLPRRPRVGRRVELRSRALDSFSPLARTGVRWRFPKRAVGGSRFRTGRTIHVRYRHAGRFNVRITVVDRAGNRRTKYFTAHVRQPR